MKLDLGGLDQFKASALLGDLSDGAVPTGSLPDDALPPELSLDLIDFDPQQPRRSICAVALDELAASIRAQGVLEPVSLRRHPACPGRYVVNRGERRVRACRLAGRSTVPWFLDERVDPYAQAIENLQREDLSPFDLARFIAQREQAGDSRAEIARRLHKPASFITEAARLIDAPAEVRAAFEDGRARDTRVLYRLARGLREQPAAVLPLLAGGGALTRERLDAALVAAPAGSARSAGNPPSGRVVEGTKLARALLVEHAGRKGRLGCQGQPGRRTAQVQFEDGTRGVVELCELRLIAWTAR